MRHRWSIFSAPKTPSRLQFDRWDCLALVAIIWAAPKIPLTRSEVQASFVVADYAVPMSIF